jgi:hypothetical protein
VKYYGVLVGHREPLHVDLARPVLLEGGIIVERGG